MTRLQSLLTRITRHLGDIAAARRRTLEGTDPEGLHDLRVALRGLRVVLPLFGRKGHLPQLRRDWQALARATGPSRDLEVLIDLLDTLPGAPADIRPHLEREESVARAQLLQILSGAQLPILIQQSRSALEALFSKACPVKMQQRVTRRARKLQVILQQHIDALSPTAPPESWHLLRLDVKRLRYLLEHCKEWVPAHWNMLHPQLKRSQELLGNLHDLDMLIDLTGMPMTEERQKRQDAAAIAVAALTVALDDM